jgi:hypothetical protein
MTIVCDSCGSDDIDIRQQDVFSDVEKSSGMGYHTVHHCICNQCFEEWVE